MNSTRPSPDLATLVSLAGTAVDDAVLERLTAQGLVGLRVRHGHVVQRLLDGPRTATELAEELGVSQQAMSKTVVEMERLGYLGRIDGDDRRRRPVVLTPAAHEALDAARRVRTDLTDAVLDRIGAEDLAVAASALHALLEALGLGDAVADHRVPPSRESS